VTFSGFLSSVMSTKADSLISVLFSSIVEKDRANERLMCRIGESAIANADYLVEFYSTFIKVNKGFRK